MRVKMYAISFISFMVICAVPIFVSAQTRSESSTVTAVSGESWLVHLHRTFDETSMGKTGRLGPAEPVRSQQTGSLTPLAEGSQRGALTGGDLYRLNCRGCHGEFGAGAPPEINSVINPVRASSVAAIMARMKSAGAQISRIDANNLAEQSKTMLLQRLHNGGQDMPAFPQLSTADIRVLMVYLKQLADVPAGESEHGVVKASQLRVGELIAKSTCHTCHSATGENPTPKELSDGAIPPLSTLTTRVSRAEFVRKVTQGAPIVMGEPALVYRGRMPVFYYLTEEEAADAYQYLLTYPPNEANNSERATALSQAQTDVGGDPPKVAVGKAEKVAATPNEDVAMKRSIVLPVAGLLVVLWLGGGAVLTILEMKKLTGSSRRKKPALNSARPPVASIRRDVVA